MLFRSVEHIRCDIRAAEDERLLKEKVIADLPLSDIAIEISILLMCSEDNSVERVKEIVKGILYGV